MGGAVVAALGITSFWRAGTTVDPHDPSKTSVLVESGIYRFTRNPMYLGLALVLVGFAVAQGDIVATIVGVGGFVSVITRVQIQPEERLLRDRFGSVYDDYCNGRRRWI